MGRAPFRASVREGACNCTRGVGPVGRDDPSDVGAEFRRRLPRVGRVLVRHAALAEGSVARPAGREDAVARGRVKGSALDAVAVECDAGADVAQFVVRAARAAVSAGEPDDGEAGGNVVPRAAVSVAGAGEGGEVVAGPGSHAVLRGPVGWGGP